MGMRTFHVGGAAQKISTKSDIFAPYSGIIIIKNNYTIVDSKKSNINMSRNCELYIESKLYKTKFQTKIPYGAKIFFKDKEKIMSGEKIAEWDPFTLPIISEVNGYIEFIDFKESISVKKI